MINAGISFALDRTGKTQTSKEAMAQKIVELEAQVAQLAAVVNKVVASEGKE